MAPADGDHESVAVVPSVEQAIARLVGAGGGVGLVGVSAPIVTGVVVGVDTVAVSTGIEAVVVEAGATVGATSVVVGVV